MRRVLGDAFLEERERHVGLGEARGGEVLRGVVAHDEQIVGRRGEPDEVEFVGAVLEAQDVVVPPWVGGWVDGWVGRLSRILAGE